MAWVHLLHYHILCCINILHSGAWSLTWSLFSNSPLSYVNSAGLDSALEGCHAGLILISIPLKCEWNPFVVSSVHCWWCARYILCPRGGFKANKGFYWHWEQHGRVGSKDTHIWRQSLIGHCTTVSQYGFSHVPALCIILPSLSLRFLHCSSSFRILWTGAKNQGSATIQQIKLGDQGAVIHGVWGQTAMPSDSEKAIIILVCFSPLHCLIGSSWDTVNLSVLAV